MKHGTVFCLLSLLPIIAMVCGSCDFITERITKNDAAQGTGRISVYVPEETEEADSSSDAAPQAIPVSVARTLTGRQALLEQGNMRTAGIPGFGENALPAVAGEYRIGGEGEGHFRVWMCRELLYFDGWEAGPETQFRVLRKEGPEGQLAAAAFNDVWTGVFLFNEPESAGESAQQLSQDDIERIINVFGNRFLYFVNLTSRLSDVSLPASIDF